MTEVIKTLATIFSTVSLAETAIFLMYCFLGCSIYFLFQVWFPEYIKAKRQENDREDKRMKMFDDTLQQITVLLQQNTDIIQNFNRSISILDSTLDKVSDKLHAHDAKADGLNENIRNITKEISHFRENTPSIIDINRLHTRIDDIKTDLSDKHDVDIIIQKLDQILEVISQIRGKIM